ncbi:uncharacterized protein LOC129972207 [Argiope bruennichi]|uniref:uncharacterized protein LOC129972207 n=1 Tax=Argiope bruennichi TaxID=94029 RepID=UPI00249534B3|nr:uncharacterized protein LOC129972207 [Argiope bruennichi]
MGENKIFCVNCLKDVDADTHQNCTLTIYDWLAAEERDDAENFQQNQAELNMQQQRVHNSRVLKSGNGTKNLSKRRSDCASSEAAIQPPMKVICNNRNSINIRILGAHNPRNQHPQIVEDGNNILRHEEDSELHHDPVQMCYSEAAPMSHLQLDPVSPDATDSEQRTGPTAFESMMQQENEFQNIQPRNNESNKFYQEYTQFNDGQNFVGNNLQTITNSDFPADFREPVLHMKMNIFEAIRHQHDYTTLENQYISHEPHPSITNSYIITPVENYPETLNTLPSGSENTVALNYVTRDQVMENKETAVVDQNDCLSTNLVSLTEMQIENKEVYSKIEHNLLLKTCSRSIQQKTVKERTLQKIPEKTAYQKNVVRCTPKKHVEKIMQLGKDSGKSVQQKKVFENSMLQKNPEKGIQQENVFEKNMQQGKDSEKGIQQEKGSEKSMQQRKDSEKGIQQEKGSEKSMQQGEDSEKSIQQEKGSEKSMQQGEDSEKGIQQEKGSEKSMQQGKDSEKGIQQEKGSEKSMQQGKDSEKGIQQEKGSEKSMQQGKDSEKGIQQEKGSEKSMQQGKDSEKGIEEEKGSEKSMQQWKHPEKDVQQKKGPDKDMQQKDSEKSAYMKKKTEKSEKQKQDTETSRQENDSDAGTQQDDGGRFTGEGYKSIHEFIEALNNGTLYKRF